MSNIVNPRKKSLVEEPNQKIIIGVAGGSAADDIRLCRRLKRDTAERGRSVISVLEQYNKFVKKAFRDFILPTAVYADIIIPGFRNNRVSVDFIVQNIKNMAKRITFKERAVKTKTFIFGESEIYDLECNNTSSESHIMVSVEQESFLVFPTSNEHKKELEFFLTSLLSEIFSVEYFFEVYQNQFIKVLKALLRQLISLKNFDAKKMEVFSVYDLYRGLESDHQKYPIKLVFFPVAEVEYARIFLEQVHHYLKSHPGTTIIILNAFCEMSVPNLIYRLKLSNVIMVNLFVIANDKRFREIMTNNIAANTESFEWFVHNHEIANAGVESIAKEFNISRLQKNE
ncbi:uncharacterized protein LOC116245181 [Nymphaea colorata]|nr:uncharacterized protein LOC116245181 [Nymphaea colorata]